MKIRAITLGLSLFDEDFANNGVQPKLLRALEQIKNLHDVLAANDYEVQTTRICLNSFEDWNPQLDMGRFAALFKLIIDLDIKLCAIGACSSSRAIAIIPEVLAMCDRVSTSVQLPRIPENIFAPDYAICLAAAEACLGVARSCGDSGNFRYCIGFNCPAGIPFFPTAFHDSSRPDNSVSIGLENADLLFLAFFGASSLSEGQQNFAETLRQTLGPINQVVEAHCAAASDLHYTGIDASINPGLSLPDSVGVGMEHIINIFAPTKKFGEFGTLSAVSAITSAIRQVREEGLIKLAGYSGLMLPVMEDLILAERAAQVAPSYSLRDLLVFSSVCGVGLDTVPIPGNSTAAEIAAVYMETGTLAYRLNKPLTTRLLPLAGKLAGELSEVDHPCLVNTKVFSVV